MSDLPIVERLNDEAMRLQGRGIDRGCVDSSLAGNLALEASALIDGLYEALEKLVKRTPFKPASGGISLFLSLEQIAEHRALLAKARGEQ